MRNDFLEIVFLVLALVCGASCEELLPKVCGLGFPVLLTSVHFLLTRGNPVLGFLFAAAAGATEDALCSLTPMTSVSYFLLTAALVRQVGLPRVLTVLAYPCYQLWLAVWTGGLNVFSRLLLAFPVGLVTALVVGWTLSGLLRKAAIDERG